MRLLRRHFLQSLLSSSASVILLRSGFSLASQPQEATAINGHSPTDGPNLGEDWEGLNPGYWRISAGRIRRSLSAIGDRARNTGFPFHYESQKNPEGVMPRKYDPSLPMGTLWNRWWKLTGSYSLRLNVTVRGLSSVQRDTDDPSWAMYDKGYGLFGLTFGGSSQFESFYPSPGASPAMLVKEDGTCGLFRYSENEPVALTADTQGKLSPLKEGDQLVIAIKVADGNINAEVMHNGSNSQSFRIQLPADQTDGWFGIAARGLLDVEIEELSLEPYDNKALNAPLNDCHVCYPLGDTLLETEMGWQVRFVGIFRSAGDEIAIRVADQPNPPGGWESVPVAGTGDIVSNDFRSNTAVVDVLLPNNPSTQTMYYTIWKDGHDVTADPRIGTDSVGPGTGLVGDVPAIGGYVGRLPQLTAPYRVCGLSCHAIHTSAKAELPESDGGHCGHRIVGAANSNECGISQPFYVHDQPCEAAFKHIEDFNYQIMLWEDDVWYLELLLYPPSTEDAYKIVTTSIAGPTTRWQMMRHWNVLNPGDHDHGMDDVKGPEQLLIRNRNDLGQDQSYMVRNFQIVSHLMTGKENPSGKDNPKRWRKWKMPDRDFTIMVMDSRLWRTSQDPAIWDDEGWGHDKEIYSRLDPTRTLLGEEQFAWLSNELRTDSSPLICLTGINVLHTIWGGHGGDDWLNKLIDRDRVSADYAGWVKAGADRIIDLISARGGVVSVYGDVHAGSIIRNKDKHIYECSFGPIGRWGGRSLIDGFARHMKDFDGRPVEVLSLYHHIYKDADLALQDTVNYWNVLEAEFDPRPADAKVKLAIRNITDTVDAEPRGGKMVEVGVFGMGRESASKLPKLRTLNNADVLFLSLDGDPIRGTRSLPDGTVPVKSLVGMEAGEDVVVLATRDGESDSKIVRLLPI